jgi:DNA ligase-1
LQIFLEEVIAKGGEGVIIKNPKLPYFRGRSRNILKVKRFSDAEAVVVAINPGKGKYKNMMGSLTVRMFDGTRFRIGTGFSDQERKNPPAVGSIVTFKYCGWTQKHKPKFASFLRKRNIKTVVVK